MDVVVGKPTAKLHTSIDGDVQTNIRKKRDKKGLYNRQEQILNIYKQ